MCLGAFLATPLMIWLHMTLSHAGERSHLFSGLAMVSFLGAWLAVITFVTTLVLLLAVGLTG